jgi:hypothetical protein
MCYVFGAPVYINFSGLMILGAREALQVTRGPSPVREPELVIFWPAL